MLPCRACGFVHIDSRTPTAHARVPLVALLQLPPQILQLGLLITCSSVAMIAAFNLRRPAKAPTFSRRCVGSAHFLAICRKMLTSRSSLQCLRHPLPPCCMPMLNQRPSHKLGEYFACLEIVRYPLHRQPCSSFGLITTAKTWVHLHFPTHPVMQATI